MSGDLLELLTGGKERLEQPAADPTDYLVRTVYGEADPQADSRQAVASVILNRARKSGKTYDQVVQEPGQFEPWSDPKAKARMLALDPGSDDYKQILADIGPVLKGDVSLPYTHFYSPGVLRSRGKGAPSFDNGSGKQVGSQLFFAADESAPDLGAMLGDGSGDDKASEDAYAQAFGGSGASATADQASGPATIALRNGKIVFGDTGQPVPEGQTKAIQTLYKAGLISGDAPAGSVNSPYVQRSPDDQFQPGQFYIEAGTGTLRQTPGAKQADAGFIPGVEAGLGDIPNSLMKLIPGHEDSPVYNAMDANRLVYDATHQGDRGAQLGRFTGQIAGSVPLMMGGEAALGALASKAPTIAGPALDFLGGSAGGNLLVRGGSLAARGAGQGAEAALLTSAASDRPLGEQLLHGAEAGAILGPIMPGAGMVANKLGEHLSQSPVATSVADLARTAVEKYGIPLRASQIKGTADRGMAYKDSQMIGRFGTGYASNQAAQKQAFTKAVAGTFGEDADALTPEVMNRAKHRIGSEFDRVASGTTITDTNRLQSELDRVVSEAGQVLPDSDVAPLQKQVDNIKSAIKDGVLSGEGYQALTRRNSPLDRATESANPNIRHYAQELKGTLDDALASAATPENAQALSQAKWQYKNLMTVKNLAAKAGVSGEISPALLHGAVNTSFRNRAFTGAGDLGELAQIGQTFMKEPPNSGTAPRLTELLKGGALGAGGLGEGLLLFHDPGTALKLAAGAGALGLGRLGSNAIAGAVNRSPGVVNKLIERAQSGSTVDSPAYAISQALARAAQPTVIPAAAITANNLMPDYRLAPVQAP
jgi:hypothetical protein